MHKTLYLVRHAQCIVKPALGFPGWPLSPVGVRQAEQLVHLLGPLGIAHVFSSPFAQAIATARPFAQRHALDVLVIDDLRERLIVCDSRHPSDEFSLRGLERIVTQHRQTPREEDATAAGVRGRAGTK